MHQRAQSVPTRLGFALAATACLVTVQYLCARVMLRSIFKFGEPIAAGVITATLILVVFTLVAVPVALRLMQVRHWVLWSFITVIAEAVFYDWEFSTFSSSHGDIRMAFWAVPVAVCFLLAQWSDELLAVPWIKGLLTGWIDNKPRPDADIRNE